MRSTTEPDDFFEDNEDLLAVVREAVGERYEVREEVGRGGMGVVFQAHHRVLKKDVAVKLHQQVRTMPRFLREGRLLARLRSPRVVTIHDCIRIDATSAVIIMEWIEGGDLDRLMKSRGGRIAEHESRAIMTDVCEGMSALQAEGLVHRDLKPGNILIDGASRALVADFGLAKDPLAADGLSQGDAIMGTALYMAPEQAENPAVSDPRSDIYSFGATFYHALVGAPPFQGTSAFNLLFQHKTHPLTPPREKCPEMSESLSSIIERCLAKSPAARFESFEEVASALSEERSAWERWGDPQLEGHVGRFRERAGHYLGAGNADGVMDVYAFPSGRTLELKAGDITGEAADAIVSSDDELLTMTAGVSAAIRRAGGTVIHEEAKRFAPVRPGRCAVTSAGSLPARYVMHGITLAAVDRERPSRDLIAEILASCVYNADSLRVQTMAVPLLGTGTGGFSREICLETIFHFFAHVLQHGLTDLKTVKIVIHDDPGDRERHHQLES